MKKPTKVKLGENEYGLPQSFKPVTIVVDNCTDKNILIDGIPAVTIKRLLPKNPYKKQKKIKKAGRV